MVGVVVHVSPPTPPLPPVTYAGDDMELKDAYQILERYPMFYTREHGRYVLFSYHWQDMKTFRECPDARELRGIVFDIVDEEVVSRPFPKFFNYGEPGCEIGPEDEVSLNEKIDGSLAVASYHNGEIVVTSKGGFDTWVVKRAEQLLTDAHKRMISAFDNCTFMFELLDPDNPVVIQHENEALVLVGIREKYSGYHFPPEDIKYYGELMGIQYAPVVGKMPAGDVPPMIKGRENYEGVVGYCGYLRIAKFKTPWYLERHKYFSEISHDQVLSDFITGRLDDIYPSLPKVKKEIVDNIIEEATTIINNTTQEVKSLIDTIDISSMTRKDYALYVIEKGDPCLRHIYFMVYDGTPVDEAVYNYYKSKWGRRGMYGR